ncbi:MAG: TetR/AcrR family transcriptional regulator [Dehalococcoidia bacterium]|nr:MAG: TetR/AcrR family transcriptional regulator [Dehalococcoidia bacterium]
MKREKEAKVTKATSRMKARKQLLQDFMKVEIYNAAVNAVEKHGWSIISMDEIASEIGGSKGTIYYYFKSKNDLMADMWLYIVQEMSSVLLPIYDDKDLKPEEKLRKYIWSHILLTCQWWRFSKTIWSNAFFIVKWGEDVDKKLLKARKNTVNKYIDLVAALGPRKSGGNDSAAYKGQATITFIESIVCWYSEPYTLTPEQVADLVTAMLMEGLIPQKTAKER